MKKSAIAVACALSMGAEAADFTLTWNPYSITSGFNIVAYCAVNSATSTKVAAVPASNTSVNVAVPVYPGDILQCYLRALRLSDGMYSDPSAAVKVAAPSGNQLPIANIGGPYSAVIGKAITFDGSASKDPEGQPLTYEWKFDEGSALGTGARPTHIYNAVGAYTATLAVHDGANRSLPVSTTVNVADGSTSANLLLNGGFEAGSRAPWLGSGGMTNTLSDLHSGGWAYRIWGSTTQWPSVMQRVAVSAGTTYDISGWMKIINRTVGSYMFEMRWYNSSGVEVQPRTVVGMQSANTAYKYFTKQVIAPSGATQGELRFQANQADGSGYLDDLRIAVM